MTKYSTYSAWARVKDSSGQFCTTILKASNIKNARIAFAANLDIDGPVSKSKTVCSHQMPVEIAYPELF